MSEESNGNTLLYQWAAQASVIALEMVIPAAIGVGLDRLLGTVVLFAILGAVLGMTLGFWQLIKIALHQTENPQNNGVDKSPETRDNGTV